MEIVLKRENGKYKIPRFIKYRISKRNKFKFEHNGKLYDKEIKTKDKELKQVSILVQALNITNRKERLKFCYDKACELLDNDFYGKNLCEFKNNRCMHDRIHAISEDGCCRSNDNKRKCKYIKNHRCSTKCLACKFHICYCLKQKGYKYRINDIYVLKYLYNAKQKLMIYTDFFMTEEEVLKDVYKNSIIYWALVPRMQKFIKNKDND